MNWGCWRNRKRSWTQPRSTSKRPLRSHPGASQPHQNQGRVLLQKGDKQGAIDEYRQAIVLELKSPTPNNDLVAALRKAVAVLSGEEPAPKPAEAS